MIDKSTTFYEKVQRSSTIDLRDKRGRRHDLALVLTEFILALLCNRDGNLSSIHRHMENQHSAVVAHLKLTTAPQKQYPVLSYQFC
jgi:hypothetical protein